MHKHGLFCVFFWGVYAFQLIIKLDLKQGQGFVGKMKEIRRLAVKKISQGARIF